MKRLTPEAMYPAGVPDVTARFIAIGDEIRLRILESGSRDAPGVVLLHGWGASAFMHRFALSALAQSGFHAIAVDQRGHGLSAKPVHGDGLYRCEMLTRDLESLLDALRLDRVALVGQSMGGGVALRFALEQPNRVAALGLISPAGLRPIHAARIARLVSPRLLDHFAEFLVPRWLVERLLRLTYGDQSRVTEREIDEYWAPSQFPEFARAMRALVCEFDWEPLPDARLAMLRVPTLLIVGTLDRLIREAPKGVRRLPRARHLVIDGGGHDVNEEYHERVNAELVTFLHSAYVP
jgi:pimeloyl-ACP methyl ester carboxylesterase